MNAQMPSPGTLYLVPTPLDFGCDAPLASIDATLPLGTLQIAARLPCWIGENAKSLRAFLKRVDSVVPLVQSVQTLDIQELPRAVHKKGDHQSSTGAPAFDAKPLLTRAVREGLDIGLASEAGMPAIADPGSSVVRAAYALGMPVVPLSGPVSLVLALAASGLNGQNFAFVGYLPQDPAGRVQRIRELESLALKTGQTQIFIETPYRNTALLAALLQTMQANTRLALSCGLTLPEGKAFSRSLSVAQWRQQKTGIPLDLPAVFCIGL